MIYYKDTDKFGEMQLNFRRENIKFVSLVSWASWSVDFPGVPLGGGA